MRPFVARHSVHLRMAMPLWEWLREQAAQAAMPPSTYIQRKLSEMAAHEVRTAQGEHGDLSAADDA